MWGEFLVGLLLILGAAIWRALNVKRKAPGEKLSVVEYTDAFFFPEQDPELSQRHRDLHQSISVVVFQPQMGDQFLTFQVTERVLQLHQLNEEVMLRI
jgi:hypothetical protein